MQGGPHLTFEVSMLYCTKSGVVRLSPVGWVERRPPKNRKQHNVFREQRNLKSPKTE